jgi:copper chaperone
MAIQTIEIKVTGMTCGHCEMTVDKAIRSLGDAVTNVHVDRNSGTASVTYDDSKVSAQQIKEAIDATDIYSAA